MCRFLGISESHVSSIPRDNSRTYAEPGWRTAVFGRAVRAGAWLGQFAPAARSGAPPAPRSSPGSARASRTGRSCRRRPGQRLLPYFEEDIALLSELTGEDFALWRSAESRGSFEQRVGAS